MRSILLLLAILLFIIINFKCVTQKPVLSVNNFEFTKWHKSVVFLYDSLENSNFITLKKGLTNPQMIRKKIEYIDSALIIQNINKILNDNKEKNWQEMCIIYNFFEGEVNIDISTFLVVDNHTSWGFSFSHNLNIFRNVQEFNNSDLNKIESAVHSSNNNILIITKLNNKLKPTIHKILIGTGFSSFQSVLDLYDKDLL